MKIGIVQQHNTPDRVENRRRIADAVHRLAESGAQLIVNRELHDSLYFCQTENVDLCSLAEPIPSATTDFYSSLARETSTVMSHRCSSAVRQDYTTTPP